MNLNDIIKECQRLSNMMGDTFDCPVKINGRLTRTLGRVCYNEDSYEVLEISKQLLETSSENSIKSIIAHEWCHYYTFKITGERHGHDDFFKQICAQVGCTANGTKTSVERIVSEDSIYRYRVYCEHCDEFIADYSRMNKTLRNLDTCTCARCGHGNLIYIQNW